MRIESKLDMSADEAVRIIIALAIAISIIF